MIVKFLVSNKHMQLHMVLVQIIFLSAAVAQSTENDSTVEMVENSTQSALRNPIAGKFS